MWKNYGRLCEARAEANGINNIIVLALLLILWEMQS